MPDTTKRLQVILGADTSSYQKQFKAAAGATTSLERSLGSIEKQVQGAFKNSAARLGGFGEALTAIGPAGFAAAAGLGATAAAGGLAAKAILDVVDKAGKLTDLATKTSLSTGFLQDLDFVASQVGVSLDDAAGSAGKLQKTLGAALGGNTEAIQAFKDIGLEVENFRDSKFEDVLIEVFGALGQVKDEAIQVDRGVALMGKSFQSSANLVRSDLVTAFEQARQSGTKLSDETIKNADNVGDALTRLGKTTDALKDAIGGELLGAIGGGDAALGVDAITQAVKGLIAIVKDDQFQTFLNVLTGGAAGGLLDALKFGAGKLAQAAPATVLTDAQIDQKSKVTGPDLFTEISSDQGLQERAKARAAEAKKAQGEAQALSAELSKLAEQERREGIEAEKRWATEAASVAKVNEAVKAQISAAEESVFGTSKAAADEALLSFNRLAVALGAQVEIVGENQIAYNGLEQAIQGLSQGQLVALEAQLVALEKASRADANTNNDVAVSLGAVREALRAKGQGVQQATVQTETLTQVTYDWSQALEDAANAMRLLGVSAESDLGRLVGSLTSAASAAQNLQKALAAGGGGFGGLFKAQGTGILGQIGGIASGLGVVGSFIGTGIGVAKAIVGLFKSSPVEKAQKEAGKALGKSISKEMAQSFLDESKRTGKSVAQVAKEFQKAQDKAIADEKRRNVEEGLGQARSNVEQLEELVKDSTPAAQQAAAVFANALQREMLKAGLGFITTGALKGDEAFGKAQGIAGSAAGALEGFRQAGVIDQELIQAAGTIAIEAQKAAFDAAIAKGLSEQEATRASFGAISGLLRAQLNAELQSTGKISEALQKQLDEAKANGIEILADPAIESLNVQKEILATLRGQGGDRSKSSVAGRVAEAQFAGGSGGFRNFGSGTLVELHGIEGVFRPQDIDFPSMGGGVSFTDRDVAEAGHVGGPGGFGGPTNNYYIDIDENPFRTAESSRQMREFTLRTVKREQAKNVADVTAAGRF